MRHRKSVTELIDQCDVNHKLKLSYVCETGKSMKAMGLPAPRKETEPWEIIYFKLYQSQIPVIEQAIETAALMLGSDRSRGYCLEMICADFLAGANLDHGDPEMLQFSMTRFFKFLPAEQQQRFLKASARRHREFD